MKWKDCPAYPSPSLKTWCHCGKLPISSHSGTQQSKPGTYPRLGSCPVRLHHSIPELPVWPTITPATLSPEDEWGEIAGRHKIISPAKVYVDIDFKGELSWGHQSNLKKAVGVALDSIQSPLSKFAPPLRGRAPDSGRKPSLKIRSAHVFSRPSWWTAFRDNKCFEAPNHCQLQ